jgi:tRNA(adenine34) deaminase
MEIALNEARKAMQEGNLPIGAVLLINDKVIGTGRNNQVNNSDYFSHAESLLIGKNAQTIKEASKRKEKIELFTTLEPCLMCFGTLVHNRISRIVYACKDPLAGATTIQSPTDWYQKRWPEIVGDIDREISYELFARYMGEHSDTWENALRQFGEMKKGW